MTAIDRAAFAELEELAGDDKDFLNEILMTYIEQVDVVMGSARDALAAGDTVAFIRAVHTLNGSSRNVGAVDVARLCAAIEHDARLDPAAASHAALRQLVEPTRLACEAFQQHLRA
ncbi:MAG TPA: Hpt domain-containing protein [Thermoanaerobaculia bacterium]|nr:Hpt domain-containing protein [Thermoanaerobaculia bacterium]